jgi:hypothetical protein
MTFLKLAKTANLACFGLAGALVLAGTHGCSNSPGPPAQAFVYGEIGPGTMSGIDDSGACGQGDLTWTLGNPVSPSPVSLADGSTQVGEGVKVSCSVDPSGDGFDVQLAAELDGPTGGTLFVSGQVTASGGTGLSATFTTEGQTFEAMNNCTFTLMYNGSPLPSGGQPASGRIWGHLDCPLSVEDSQQGIGADGGTITRTCDGSADFLFENCD